jgi:hypothetical protein
VTGNGRRDNTDPLLNVAAALRDALAPFGIAVGRFVPDLWRDLQGHGISPFTGSGEFDPAAVARIEAAVALMRASTADAPTPGPGAPGGTAASP